MNEYILVIFVYKFIAPASLKNKRSKNFAKVGSQRSLKQSFRSGGFSRVAELFELQSFHVISLISTNKTEADWLIFAMPRKFVMLGIISIVLIVFMNEAHWPLTYL